MLALAPEHHLRLIAVNMRDYPGSTPNTKEELEDLGNSDPQRQAKYIKSAALQIGTFVAKAITLLSLPAPSSDKDVGGVTVLGWSSGTLYMSSLLAHAADLPKEDKVLLEKYLRTVVMFGVSVPSLFDRSCLTADFRPCLVSNWSPYASCRPGSTSRKPIVFSNARCHHY